MIDSLFANVLEHPIAALYIALLAGIAFHGFSRDNHYHFDISNKNDKKEEES